MFDKFNEALKNWKSLLPMLKPFVRSETKTAVRRKKMNITTAPNGTVIGVTDPADNTEIKIPYQPSCGTLTVGKSVWVEWLYDNFSTAIAVTPGDGLWGELYINKRTTFVDTDIVFRDSSSVVRTILNQNGQLGLYDANGATKILLRGDGSASATPLPVNQGGTGMNANHKTISSIPTETFTSYDFSVTSGFYIGDGVTLPTYAKGHYMAATDAVLWAVGANNQFYFAFRNNGNWHGRKDTGSYFVDTRNVNSTPNDYITNNPRSFVTDFKLSSTIGLPSGSPMYAILITFVPWTDSSGGWPTQLAIAVGKMYIRAGTSGTAWGSWTQL